MKNRIEFFMPMVPPTTTHQEKRIAVRGGRPIVYEDERLADARRKLTAHLARHRPQTPMAGAVELLCIWQWTPKSPDMDGRYKTSRPDTDNLQKLLKDCMTAVGFWKDDAQVCNERCVKRWGRPGIYVAVSEIHEDGA